MQALRRVASHDEGEEEMSQNQIGERVVFMMECCQADDPSRSYIALTLKGEWDMDMLEGLTSFVVHQRKRIRRTEHGPHICDGWEAACNGSA